MKSKKHQNKSEMMERSIKTNEELGHEVEELTTEIHRSNSSLRIFFNGILSGLGRAIGATIIFAILISLISYIIRTSDAEWLRVLVTGLGLDTYLK